MNGRCIHCSACISKCPRSAIEYGKKTRGKKRYLLNKLLDNKNQNNDIKCK
ncbi:4Fe-4S dicluster domain-containing protein [Anaerococcus sp. NML200537]|uniref:4Fe-4S dicluster domain-containing protein n=1 Tax=Anaerococcus sp. NML200537 TaxID=2954485 RepID=UPI0039C90337